MPGPAVPFGHVVPFQLHASVSPSVKQGGAGCLGDALSGLIQSAGPLGLS